MNRKNIGKEEKGKKMGGKDSKERKTRKMGKKEDNEW